MSEQSFVFRTNISRRIPDPNFKKSHNMERHLFLMAVRDIPADLPLDPNARRPNIRKRIYKDVRLSLYNDGCEPGTFHLKNKGITIIAHSVTQARDDEYVVKMRRGVHGIVDGGHTYTLIRECADDPLLPKDQYVQVEIRVGIPEAWIADIAGGLNTSVQVQDMSLENLEGSFKPLKTLLKGEKYFKRIAWSENDPGEYDARDILAMLAMFNISLFPNDQDEHPVMAYEKKSAVLKLFQNSPAAFYEVLPIAKDILLLHDRIAKDAREIWNRYNKGRAGNLAFMEKRQRGSFDFIFVGEQSEYRLTPGALYPIMAAFRWYVSRDLITGELKWRDGFPAVLKAWQEMGGEMLKATHLESDERGRNPNAVGKSRLHWANLHTRVARRDLEARQAQVAV